MKKESKYYFGRVNIISPYFSDKHDFISFGLKSDHKVEIGKYLWGFGTLETLKLENDSYFCSSLIKFNQLSQNKHKKPRKDLSYNNVNAESRFFINIKSGIIAFQLVTGKINLNQFLNNFPKVFKKDYVNKRVEVYIIAKEEKFLESINHFSSIKSVDITLVPPNPSSRRIFREISEKMINDGIAKSKENNEIKTDRDGKELIQSRNEEGKIAMASDGLGKVEVTGTVTVKVDKNAWEFREETTSTDDFPETSDVPQDPQDSNDNKSILKKLINKFKNILYKLKEVEVN